MMDQMKNHGVSAVDAVTKDEITGVAPSTDHTEDGDQSTSEPPRKRARNACKPAVNELMSPSRKAEQSSVPPRSAINPHPNRTRPDPHTGVSLNNLHGRDALGAYILKPESFPSPQRVLRYDKHFVTIHDVYAKSSMHLLVLPRDPAISSQHPFDALADPNFLQSMKGETEELKRIMASELRRMFGKYSKADAARNDALSSPNPPEELPEGRDWEAEILVGVHAHPSMNHMHVHLMSCDRHSEALKHRKHYNSFSTRFFVPLEDFPLAEGDPRRHPGKAGFLAEDMKCWRCGKNYGNKFKALKAHLEEEFEEWKRK